MGQRGIAFHHHGQAAGLPAQALGLHGWKMKVSLTALGAYRFIACR